VAAGGQRESKLGLANVHLLMAQLKLVGRRGGGDDVLEGVFGVASREERAMHLCREGSGRHRERMHADAQRLGARSEQCTEKSTLGVSLCQPT
jgi:hypothetical protein